MHPPAIYSILREEFSSSVLEKFLLLKPDLTFETNNNYFFPPIIHELSRYSEKNALKKLPLLAKTGSDLNAFSTGDDPRPLLIRFIVKTYFEAATLLLNLGAKVEIEDTKGKKALHFLLEKINNENFEKALMLFQKMVEKGLDINQSIGKTPFLFFLLRMYQSKCLSLNEENFIKFFNCLLSYQPDLTLQNEFGESLQECLYSISPALVKLIS